ncbi:MAG: hypothetical protein AABW63_01750 [Nanoarchaeota archaeon]
MAEKGKKLTKEEEKKLAELREKARGYALDNLGAKSSILNLAAAYFADRKNAYGDAGNSAVDQYLYQPTIDGGARYTDPQTGKEVGLMSQALLGSREDGDRYTGTLTERKILKKASQILAGSASLVKLADILQSMGSKVELKPEYANVYVADVKDMKMSDLLGEGASEEEKKALGKVNVADYVLDNYTQWLTDTKVAEALTARAKDARSGLEEILKKPEKAKKS